MTPLRTDRLDGHLDGHKDAPPRAANDARRLFERQGRLRRGGYRTTKTPVSGQKLAHLGEAELVDTLAGVVVVEGR